MNKCYKDDDVQNIEFVSLETRTLSCHDEPNK